MQTLTAPSIHLTDDPLTDKLVELNANVLKLDLGQADPARAALLSVGIRTKLINRHWPGSRTRQYAILWGNQAGVEKATGLAAGKAALAAAGFEIGR